MALKPRHIAVIIVACLLLATLWATQAKDDVDVNVADYGMVKAELTAHYTDGTSKALTRFKSPEPSKIDVFRSSGNNLESFEASFYISFDESRGDDVRMACARGDITHMSTLYVERVDVTRSNQVTKIASYPLSLTVSDDHLTVRTGEYAALWSGVDTTTTELSQLEWPIGSYKVRWRLVLWANFDPSTDEVEGAQVTFSLPIEVASISSVADLQGDPDPVARDPSGGSSGGGSSGGTTESPPATGSGTVTWNTDKSTYGAVKGSYEKLGRESASSYSWGSGAGSGLGGGI